MNILYFHQHFSTPAGSTGTRPYEMAIALVKAGHEVTMVCGSHSNGVSGLSGPFKRGRRSGYIEGLLVIEFDISYSNYNDFITRSWKFIKYTFQSSYIAILHPCDLVLASSTPLTTGLPGIFARWLRGRRFVFEVRDLVIEASSDMEVINSKIFLWMLFALEKIFFRSAHACIGLSPKIIEKIKKSSKIDMPVIMIPNGCDFELFSGDSIRPKRPNGVKETDMMAVFSGTHGYTNGLNSILNAAEILNKSGNENIKIVFIGDGILKPKLQREAKRKKLNNCLFLDRLPKAELAAYLKGADIGLMILANIPTFYYGTSPNKFFDYLSAGLPVLNNYPGWLADMIREHECGYSVEPDNASLLADALIDAAANPEKIAEMSYKALALGREKFDRKKQAEQFVSWLERVAEVS